MNAIERIQQLRKELHEHNYKYYVLNEPSVSDQEFDAMMREFGAIRAGRANVHILDEIRVDSYGSMVPLSNVASLNTPDARSITIKPWEKSMLRVIEKAIIDSSVGIMPENNGEIIRLGIPPLTEERRKELVKQVKGVGETARISLRNARRDAVEAFKKAQKEGMPEDEAKDGETQAQKLLEKFSKKIDELMAAKEKEIMTV